MSKAHLRSTPWSTKRLEIDGTSAGGYAAGRAAARGSAATTRCGDQSRSAKMHRIQEASRGLEDKRTADVWRLVDVQERALATERDGDSFVKGTRSKGLGHKGAGVCKNCGQTGRWARCCRKPGGRIDGKRSSTSKSAVRKFDGYCRH